MRSIQTTVLRMGAAALAFGFVLALGAASAQAGVGVTTIHPLQIKGKALFQGEGKIEKENFDNRDIQELCCGELDKDNDLFLTFTDACLENGGLTNNEIQVRNKDTGSVVKSIGAISPLFAAPLSETKDGDLKSQTFDVRLVLACNGTTFDLFGILTVDFDKDGCAGKATFETGGGQGSVDGVGAVFEKAKAKANKDASDKFEE